MKYMYFRSTLVLYKYNCDYFLNFEKLTFSALQIQL